MSSVGRQRRALSHVGGLTQSAGDSSTALLLAKVLDVTADETTSRTHVHGFHSYPARLHPLVASTALELFAPHQGSTILDPFCGSGTTLVETRLQGHLALGVDLNPLAVRLARLKAFGRSTSQRADLIEGAHAVAAVAEERRKRRAGASRRYPDTDMHAFDPHVLLELDGLRFGLETAVSKAVRFDLELVLSAILTKLSHRRGDSAEGYIPKRIAAGYPTRLFLQKTNELAERLADYSSLLPRQARPAEVLEGDARCLGSLADASVHLVLTSPPYPGTYDYLRHHEMRLRWLGLRSQSLEEHEMGSRRELEAHPARKARELWLQQLHVWMRELRRILHPKGAALLILGDSVVSGQPFYNDELVRLVAPQANLQMLASASQARPHFHAASRNAFEARPRCEHALLLIRKHGRTF